MTFKLDATLEADTVEVLGLDLTTVRLMNDARFPWLILVPCQDELVELTDLNATDRHGLMDEVTRACDVLRIVFPESHKMNVAALGNMVRQLHVHVIARRTSDAAWPNPVWGVGHAEPYPDDTLQNLVARLKCAFDDGAS